MKYCTFIFLVIWVSSCSKAPERINAIEVSYVPSTAQGYRIDHNYFSLSYSNTHRLSEFVYYYLSPQSINGGQVRKDNFRIDPLVRNNPVTSNSYVGCGFDRGHLCPASDMALNETAMSETFYMSNISPMTPSFNRGIWSSLEAWVRKAALANNGIYVATGPILNESCGQLTDRITIPCSYYKIAFKGGNNPKIIGFVMANAPSNAPLKTFVVSIDEIEKKTGLNFFPQLEDGLEILLESKVNLNEWDF